MEGWSQGRLVQRAGAVFVPGQHFRREIMPFSKETKLGLVFTPTNVRQMTFGEKIEHLKMGC